MTGAAFAFLAFVSVSIFAWPLWAALILAQLVMLVYGYHEFRWLPLIMLCLGYVGCAAWLLVRGG